MATETQVHLKSATLSERRVFNITHAQRVLDKQREDMKGSDWQLDEPKYTVKNGVIQLADSGKDQNTGPKKPTT